MEGRDGDLLAENSLGEGSSRNNSFGNLADGLRKNLSSNSFYVASQAHLLRPTAENPLPTAVPPPISATAGTLGVRHVLSIIGLPERGKPFIAARLSKYLSFFHGAEVKLFNLNDYCKHGPAESDENAEDLLKGLKRFMGMHSSTAARNLDMASRVHGASHSSSPVEPSPLAAAAHAEAQAHELLIDEKDRRRKNVDSGKVAIIYATESFSAFSHKWAGTSKERRRWAADTLAKDKELGAKLIFIEVIVDRSDIMHANLKAKQRSTAREADATSNDCEHLSDETIRTFNTRVQQYQRMYVTMQDDGSEDDLSYIQLINYGQKVVTNRMHGYLRMRIAQFLTVIHPTPHSIYLTRHGQSEYNVLGKIGGNPPLTPAGEEYSRRLGEWVPQNMWRQNGSLVKCRLWTSSLQRTILTAANIPHPMVQIRSQERANHYDLCAADAGDDDELHHMWEQMSPRVYRNLDEIFAGEYEGKTYADIKKLSPNEASLRAMDKIGYRYPRGESYFDILARLDPLVHELESYHEPLLLVSHQAVLRMLYAYLMGMPRTAAPKIDIPLHTVMKITYDGWHPPTEERCACNQLAPVACER